MVYGLYCALPGDRLSCHRRPQKLPSANLTPASGRQDHTSLPSANSALVFGAACVHRILSRVCDDLEPPLFGTGRRTSIADLGQASSENSENQKLTAAPRLRDGGDRGKIVGVGRARPQAAP